MVNSKNILLAVVVFITLYIGLEIKKTRDAVTDANDKFYSDKKPFSTKESHKTAYGFENKPKSKPEKDEKVSVEIFGNIDKSMTYMISTLYATTSDEKSCRSYNSWSGGDVPSSEDFEYYPKIEGEQHKITVPLRVFNPYQKCKFKLVKVDMHIFSRENKRKRGSTLLFADDPQILNNERYEIRLDSSHKIDMECVEPSLFPQAHYNPCGYKPLTDVYSIVKNIPTRSVKYEINIDKLPIETLSKEELRLIEIGKLQHRYGRTKAPNQENTIKF